MRQLQWGASWLEIFLRRLQDNEEAGINERLMALVDFLAVSIRHKHFPDATLALVTEIASQLECERVSVGFVRKQQSKTLTPDQSSDCQGAPESRWFPTI